MMLQSEGAIAEVVYRRLGAKWFWGLVLFTALVLCGVATSRGAVMSQKILANRQTAFAVLNFLTLLLVVVISASEIPRDISGRVLLIILSKPLARHQFITGKFLGIIGVGLAYFAMGAVVVVGALWYAGLPPDGVVVRLAMIGMVRMTLVAAVALLLTTRLSETPVIALTMLYVVLGHAVPQLGSLLSNTTGLGLTGYLLALPLYLAPNMVTFSPPVTVLSYLFAGAIPPTDGPMKIGLDRALRQGVPDWGELGVAVLYTLTYVCIFLALAISSFRTRRVD